MARPSLSWSALALLAACTSDHRVSPFPQISLSDALRPPDDLPAQLARAQREASAAGLRSTLRIDGTLPGGQPFVALGFEGTDPAGRPTHAVRAVTPAAVVLAVGPARLVHGEAARPDELLRSLLPGGAFPSGSDLTGDKAPDLVLRASDGALAIYRLDLLGASPYPVSLRSPPTSALDLNEDGRPDLAGSPPVPAGDPIHPELLDIAVADGVSFRNDHPAVIAYHQRLADAPAPAPDAPLARRLQAALEKAFHAHCAGAPLGRAFQPAADLAAASHPLPDAVAASWVRWRGWLVDSAAGAP